MSYLRSIGVALALTTLLLVLWLPSTQAAGDVNGAWTRWSRLASKCTKTCGGGTRQKIRTCTNPPPEGAGTMCTLEDGTPGDIEVKAFNCSMQSCWSLNPVYTDWSNCSAECDLGLEYRHAVCDEATGELCTGNQQLTESQECTTWDIATCPNPCDKVTCPRYSICKNESTVLKPVARCSCTMGFEMKNGECKRPPPTTPTPRPIPTLPKAQKIVATVISKTASTVLIVCVSITLAFFLIMRIFTPDRVIQMNMEIALLAAHLFLLFPSETCQLETLCRFVSIMLHFLFTAVFMFMMLESLHMYSLVAQVVRKNGMFSRAQNIAIGWGVSMFIVLFTMCYEYKNYGAPYHCWLQMDKGVTWAQQIPMYALIIITFTLTEAAGAAEYKQLQGVEKSQLTSAKFSQRTNLLILPVVYAHWLLGTLSEYQQNLALYSIFSIMNAVLGVMVMVLHCSCNEEVRARLTALVDKVRGKKKKPEPVTPVGNPSP